MSELRLRYCGARGRFDVADATRGDALKSMAKALTRAGAEPERAERILSDAAKASPAELHALQAGKTETWVADRTATSRVR